jgi:hypothetical protein
LERCDPNDDDSESDSSSDSYEGWICSKINGLSKCLNGIDQKEKSKGIICYWCSECDVTRCEMCVKVDIFVSCFDP